MRVYLITLLVATILAIFTRTFIVQAFRIPSGSMAPGLLTGDHVLVNKFIYGGLRNRGRSSLALLPMRSIRRGDVIVFDSPEDPGRDLIKRCLGLPGETITIEAGKLSIDDHEIDESGYASARGPEDSFGPLDLPPESYFCLGDDRSRSRDSRVWGPVRSRHLRGRAVMIYWSIRDPPPVAERTAWDKMSRVRWRRSFQLVR